MDSPADQLPITLKPYVDALVAAAHTGLHRPTGPAFDEVTQWWQANEPEANSGDGFLVVDLDPSVRSLIDDEIEDSAPMRARVAALRKAIGAVLRFEGDSDAYPMGAGIGLHAANGKTAALCFYAYDGGFAGPSFDWKGVYRNVNEFRRAIRKSGALTSLSDLKRTSNSELQSRCLGE